MKTSKLTMLSLCTALAMIFSFVESQIPTMLPPGMKLGLPNIAIVFVLYRVGVKEAYAVNLVRIVLTSLLFGSVLSLAYSLVGGMLSLTVMVVMKRFTPFSCVSVSVVGGLFHNIGQVCVAYFVTDTAQLFTYYLPMLLVSGVVAGVVIGLVAGIAVQRLEKWTPR